MTLASIAAVLGIIAAASVVVALPLVMWWLQGYFKRQGAQAEIDKRTRLQQERNWFIDVRLLPYASSKAEQWLVVRLPALAGGETSFAWSKHWQALNKFVQDAVIKKFAAEEIDIVGYLTESVLADIIGRVVLKMVKCPPPHVVGAIPADCQIIFGAGFLEFVTKYGDALLEG